MCKATIAVKRREETYRNRKHTNKHSNIQISDTQGHTVNIVPNNRELTENSEKTVSDNHIDKQDNNINTQT